MGDLLFDLAKQLKEVNGTSQLGQSGSLPDDTPDLLEADKLANNAMVLMNHLKSKRKMTKDSLAHLGSSSGWANTDV